MLNKLKLFFALGTKEQVVFIRAWFLLGCARVATLTMPFKRLAAPLEFHPGLVSPTPITPKQLQQASSIGRLVALAANYTPWQSLCLTQVLVVQRLLAKRDIPGQFCFGVRRGCEGSDSSTGLSVHAWARCGDVIVNGEAGNEVFTVISTFSWGKADN